MGSKRFKIILAVMLVFAAMLSLTACGDPASESGENASVGSENTSENGDRSSLPSESSETSKNGSSEPETSGNADYSSEAVSAESSEGNESSGNTLDSDSVDISKDEIISFDEFFNGLD